MFDGIRFSNERLIGASGLSIAGLLLNKTNLAKRLNQSRLKENAAPQIKNSDVVFTYIGLLCQGKSDFDFVREMESDLIFIAERSIFGTSPPAKRCGKGLTWPVPNGNATFLRKTSTC